MREGLTVRSEKKEERWWFQGPFMLAECRASKTVRVREQERKQGGNSEIQGLSYSLDIS